MLPIWRAKASSNEGGLRLGGILGLRKTRLVCHAPSLGNTPGHGCLKSMPGSLNQRLPESRSGPRLGAEFGFFATGRVTGDHDYCPALFSERNERGCRSGRCRIWWAAGGLRSRRAGPVPYGSTVERHAVSGAGQQFVAWGGAVSGTNDPRLFTITQPGPTVVALFAAEQRDAIDFTSTNRARRFYRMLIEP